MFRRIFRRNIYGPVDPSVLSSQGQHRSDDVPEGDIDSILHARRADGKLWEMFEQHPPHIRVLQLLHEMGFYGVFRCGQIKYDFHLITALVERWRSETHTFHFRVGEATITLQDVAVIWELPIDGEPVSGVDDDRSIPEWQDYCAQFLGFRPAPDKIKGSRILISSVASHIKNVGIDDGTPIEIVHQYTRGIVLLLLGGVMCPDSSGNLVPLLYLQKLEVPHTTRTYSWGSAVLAFLYRELCTASRKGKGNIGGALQLLQIWAWSRITPLQPNITEIRVYTGVYTINNNRVLPEAPYGARWNGKSDYTETVRTSLRVIREVLDEMKQNQFRWQPYNEADIPHQNNPPLWLSKCPLIFYWIVEIHRPERVLRQFGMRQDIPLLNNEEEAKLHRISRRTRAGTDWYQEHILYVVRWGRRYELTVPRPASSTEINTEEGYNTWYDQITRRFISSGPDRRVDTGFQPGGATSWQVVADQMTTLRLSCDSAEEENTIEGYRNFIQQVRSISNNVYEIATNQNPTYPNIPEQNPVPQDNVPTRAHRLRRSRSMRSSSSVEGDISRGRASISSPHDIPRFTTFGGDIAGPSSVYTPPSINYNIQDCYVPQPPEPGDWHQSTQYMPTYSQDYSAQVDLDLNLGIGVSQAFNVSPVQFPALSAYRDHVESSETTSSSRLHTYSEQQDEPTQPVYEERRRPRRQRQRRTCGTGGHF